MGKLFIIMGKSATGKDTVLNRLLAYEDLGLKEVVEYTTRPRRENEQNGADYHFVEEEQLHRLQEAGLVIECRRYFTIHGPWYYFNVDDGQIDFCDGNYLMITTLEAYVNMKTYFGDDSVVPLYLQISDRTRLHRALEREDLQSQPKYAELCRRFLADDEDFLDDKLERAGIVERYSNECLEDCVRSLRASILQTM